MLSYIRYLKLVTSVFYLTNVYPYYMSAPVLGLGFAKKTKVASLPFGYLLAQFDSYCLPALWILLFTDLLPLIPELRLTNYRGPENPCIRGKGDEKITECLLCVGFLRCCISFIIRETF